MGSSEACKGVDRSLTKPTCVGLRQRSLKTTREEMAETMDEKTKKAKQKLSWKLPEAVVNTARGC